MFRKLNNNQWRHFKLDIVLFGLLFILFSCDFGTQVNYKYISKSDADKSISIGWSRDGECYVYIEDETIDYDNVAIMFPTDNTPIISYLERYYYYEYDSAGLEKIDSTLYIDERFDLSEDDDRILTNDSLYVSVNKAGKILFKQTLLLEKSETEFIDRLPIPKIHG